MTTRPTHWHLYVVRTHDGSLYAGVSTDVQRRFREHTSQGRKAAKYLRAHPPHSLAFSTPIGGRSLALKVEYRFKLLSKKEKEQIVASGQLHFDPKSGRIGAGRAKAVRPSRRIFPAHVRTKAHPRRAP